MSEKGKLKIILAVLMAALLLVAGVFYITEIKDRTAQPEETASEQEVADNAEEVEDAGPSDVLFFASDYQSADGWKVPAETLRGILGAVNADGKEITNVIYCGDYSNYGNFHDYQISPDDAINEIREIVATECSGVNQDSMLFEQGNHDQLTDAIAESGLHEFDNYLVYVLNTEYDFPWSQGRDAESRDRIVRASEEMKECFDELIAAGETRPVFVAGHVPLHFSARTSSRHSTGDNMYSKYIFDVVNSAADSLDIIYVHGHNHSKGWDCYMGGSSAFKEVGDAILIPDAGDNTANTDNYTVETLKFAYLNAGYTGYYMNCGQGDYNSATADQYAAADNTLTGTLYEILPDKIIITRYSEEGLHTLGWDGEGNPYKDNIDSDLIDSKYYNTRKESPAEITRQHAGKEENNN